VATTTLHWPPPVSREVTILGIPAQRPVPRKICQEVVFDTAEKEGFKALVEDSGPK
jgi:hypothetical protein